MIYTFYSYKGGVGRSKALAEVAHCLARRGLRVLAIDFDLEAPGLEQHLALFRVHDARNRLQQRRLARTIGAQHGDDLPLVHLQRHAANGHDRAIEGFKVANLQQRAHTRSPFAFAVFEMAEVPR